MDQEAIGSLPAQDEEQVHVTMPQTESQEENPPETHLRIHRKSDESQPYVLPRPFMERLSKLETPEEKLTAAVAYMQEVLVGNQGVSFGVFWEVRRLCTDLFKQNVNQATRVQLWGQYTEICREARRLKEVFEEQSNFFTEQIEATLIALKDDFTNLEERLSHLEENPTLAACRFLSDHMEVYQKLQHELEYLNAFASRITGSRKEVLKAQIRHKQKKRLLESLAILGDLVFPRRKELIQQVSELFRGDVAVFIQNTFIGDLSFQMLIDAQEEIKALQHAARALTLSTEAFVSIREQLSQCWDGLAKELTERKKVQHERRALCKKHKDELLTMLELVKNGLESGSMSEIEARRSLHQLHSRLKSAPLASQDLKLLKQGLAEVENALEERKAYGQASKVKALEGSLLDTQKNKGLLTRLQELSKGEHDRTHLLEALCDISTIAKNISFGRADRLVFARLVTAVSKHLEEQMRRHLSPDLENLEDLKSFMLSIYEHYEVVKEHIQLLRRFCGDSGASFTEAMELTDLLGNNQELLRKLESLHSAVEERLTKVQRG